MYKIKRSIGLKSSQCGYRYKAIGNMFIQHEITQLSKELVFVIIKTITAFKMHNGTVSIIMAMSDS